MLEGFIDVTPVLRCGVYALVRDGVVVYVGQGKKMIARVEAHRSNWGRKSTPAWMPVSLRGVLFDNVYVFPCRVEDLDRIEAAMIDLYKPKFNIKLKAPTPLTAQQLSVSVGEFSVPLNFRPPPTPRFERRI
jgi:excinuclease UvrABC nuclease subunit